MKTKRLRNKKIELVLVKWKYPLGSNIAWETKENMKKCYPKRQFGPFLKIKEGDDSNYSLEIEIPNANILVQLQK